MIEALLLSVGIAFALPFLWGMRWFLAMGAVLALPWAALAALVLWAATR